MKALKIQMQIQVPFLGGGVVPFFVSEVFIFFFQSRQSKDGIMMAVFGLFVGFYIHWEV